MRQQSKEFLIILFIAGTLALNYPVLALFDRAWMPFGIPLLYLYLYLGWLLVIFLLAAVVEGMGDSEPEALAPPTTALTDRDKAPVRKPL